MYVFNHVIEFISVVLDLDEFSCYFSVVEVVAGGELEQDAAHAPGIAVDCARIVQCLRSHVCHHTCPKYGTLTFLFYHEARAYAFYIFILSCLITLKYLPYALGIISVTICFWCYLCSLPTVLLVFVLMSCITVGTAKSPIQILLSSLVM